MDLQMRSATVIRFFKMMLVAWDELRPFDYLLAGHNVSCVSFCSRWASLLGAELNYAANYLQITGFLH
jgi:hypothetical protein